jgi:hypothetical protein
LHFQALDWAAYGFLLLWALFDKKLRDNLRASKPVQSRERSN